ncbi:hypothetical protein TSUD_378310 [Trifolium subterraneum]|uniref:Tr-type G domain-containing protein n=1 Tax=Trifolium subterraneum TaxID=3900 RepID=A0A2Z6P0D9_TRISU|nr:hypothetical protein TSUD_378310 [Trifolium subterraneum]
MSCSLVPNNSLSSFMMMSRKRSSFSLHIYERGTSSISHPSSISSVISTNCSEPKLTYNILKEPVVQPHNIWISGLMDPKNTNMEARKLLYSGRVEEMRSYEIYEAKQWKHRLDRDKKVDLQIVYSYTTWKDTKINIIDTDNTIDFTISAQRALRNLDGAILVISSTNEVQSAMKVNSFMEALKVPRFLLIDKLHQKGANPWEALKKVNLVASYCSDTISIDEIPTDMEEFVSEKRKELIETISEVDDKLAMTSDGDNNPSSIDLEDSIRRATIAQKFIPVFMGSILEKGPQTLLDGVVSYFPCSVEVSKYGLDQYKNMEAASLVHVARKNIVVRSTPVHLCEYTDIFSCPAAEGESHIYVLPTQHDIEASRSDVKAMVECIRPQLLFLETDPFRSKSLEEDYNVMAVAFQAAKSIGNIEFDLGDLDECSREKLEEAAKDMVHIDIRNLIMTYRLYKHAQTYSSILALVGRNHMFGMRHYWNIMKQKLTNDAILKEAESYEECMRSMKSDYNSRPPLWLDSKIRLWDRYPDIE